MMSRTDRRGYNHLLLADVPVRIDVQCLRFQINHNLCGGVDHDGDDDDNQDHEGDDGDGDDGGAGVTNAMQFQMIATMLTSNALSLSACDD